MNIVTEPKIEAWPLVKVETNRERIVRALREADGVVPQCRVVTHRGEERCAMGVILDVFGGEPNDWLAYGRVGIVGQVPDEVLGGTMVDCVWYWNDHEHRTFAQIADRLERDDSLWDLERANRPYTGGHS